jgi:hypothetical protein
VPCICWTRVSRILDSMIRCDTLPCYCSAVTCSCMIRCDTLPCYCSAVTCSCMIRCDTLPCCHSLSRPTSSVWASLGVLTVSIIITLQALKC